MSPSRSATFDQSVTTIAAAALRGIKRQDGPSGRFYLIDGEPLPSVTHILGCIGKPALINWAVSSWNPSSKEQTPTWENARSPAPSTATSAQTPTRAHDFPRRR